MKPFRLVVGVLAAVFLARQAAVAAPIEAYGGLPSIESVEISPDGSKLAVAMSTGEQRMLGIKTLPDGVMKTFALGSAKVRRLDWVGPERLIITTSQTNSIMYVTGPRREYLMGFDLNVATSRIQPLLKRSLGGSGTGSHIHDPDADKVSASLNVLAGPPEVHVIDGTPTLFLRGITFPDQWGVLTILKVNMRTGETDIVALGDKRTDEIVLDQDGLPLARADYDDDTGQWSLKLRQGPGWKLNRTLEAKTGRPVLAGLGRDGYSVVVAETGESGVQMREVTPDGV